VTVPEAPVEVVAVKVTDPPNVVGVPEVATEIAEEALATLTLAIPVAGVL
jgi:hypothetical protein